LLQVERGGKGIQDVEGKEKKVRKRMKNEERNRGMIVGLENDGNRVRLQEKLGRR
jgi:hypothetical protein